MEFGVQTHAVTLSKMLTLAGDVPLYDAIRAVARIVIDPESPTFQECFDDNNEAETIIDGAVQCVR